MKPLSVAPTYRVGAASDFLKEARDYASELPESEEVSTLLLYVNYRDQATEQFVDQFFPFCLAASFALPDMIGLTSKNERNKRLNTFVEETVAMALKLRKSAGAMRAALSGNNLTPLLLPLRNFSSVHLRPKLQRNRSHPPC